MCHCLEVSHSGYYAWRNRGMSEIQKRREELAIFVTYFFNESKQTHLLYTGPQNLGTQWFYNQSRDGAPAHAAWRAWRGCQPRPKAHNYRACRRPGRSPRPDRKELNSRCSDPETGGRPSPICFSPGKDSCTRQAVTVLPARKELLATPWRNTCEPNWSKKLCKIGGSELPAHQGCDDFSCRV